MNDSEVNECLGVWMCFEAKMHALLVDDAQRGLEDREDNKDRPNKLGIERDTTQLHTEESGNQNLR